MNHWLQIWILPFAKLLVGLDPRLWFKLLGTPNWNYLYHMPFMINSLTVRKDRIGAVHFYITFESLGKALETLQLLNILPYVVYRQYSEWLCKLHPFSWDMQRDSVRPRQCPPEPSRRGMVALARPRLATVLPCTVPLHSPALLQWRSPFSVPSASTLQRLTHTYWNKRTIPLCAWQPVHFPSDSQ